MTVCVERIDFFRVPMKTRFPFRYGIASLTALPHLFVYATIRFNGKRSVGVSADGLTPKWFTKNPKSSYEDDDLPEMLRVIRNAADVAVDHSAGNVFDWWRTLDQQHRDWAKDVGVAPLLAGLGVSLIERAVLDAFCRASGLTLHDAIVTNSLGVDFAAVDSSLEGLQPKDILPPAPLDSIHVRHTVGLADPFDESDVVPGSRPPDRLPYTLVENIRAYGLKYFKIKIQGDPDADRERLERLATLIGKETPDARFTLDANEQYRDLNAFRDAYDSFRRSDSIRSWIDRGLLFVEQPLHRDVALDPNSESIRSWPDTPPIIIDESDAELSSLPTAMRLGYSGTSHKNCKGIIKGLITAARIAKLRRDNRNAILSAEDLGNVGPVALLQDLAMVATLGIPHAERNGHQYFAGLSMFGDDLQRSLRQHHGDLYQHRDGKFTALRPVDGRLMLGSVNRAPFGLVPLPDPGQFESWDF